MKKMMMTLAAALAATLVAAPVAAQPEVWLSHEGSGQGWRKDQVTFNLTCPAGPNPNGLGSGSYNATEPHHYIASTFFRVEARNVAGNVGDQETLPDDHPGRAWGKTMWCELWGGAAII
ncbi:MAG: hypothetical protein OXE82_06790 [Rhodobacter sp.]|nr:hypothetical protein [Rhodobacter sp.]